MSREGGPARLALTPRELASRLGISKSFIYEQIATGRLPHVRLGARRIVIELSQLDEFLELRRCSAEGAAARLPQILRSRASGGCE